jgi:DNA repair photolyase
MNGKPVYEVPAQTVINFKSGFGHKLLCDSLTFTAGSACGFSCQFCYVDDMMRKSPHWKSVLAKDPTAKFEDVVIRRKGAVEAIRKELTDRHGRPKFNDPNDRRVIYASPLVDVAANMELVKETVEICKVILELTNWHIRLLTKSNLLPKVAEALNSNPRFMDSMATGVNRARQRVIFGVSTGTLDDKLAAAFEQGTALVSKRIQSLHWLQDNGFRTFGMICPSLPQEDYFEFSREMFESLRADKLESVWSEVINARGESFGRTFDAIQGAGFHKEARMFEDVSTDKVKWEQYARDTFNAHAKVYAGWKSPDGSPRLRHLQYVTKETRDWWQARKEEGAILL